MTTEKENSFDDLTLLFTRTALKSIPWRVRRNQLVKLDFDDSVYSAILKLTQNSITAAPVFENGTFRGFSDMQQFTRICCRFAQNQRPWGPGDWFDNALPIKNTRIRDLVQGTTKKGFVYGEYCPPIPEDATLFEAVTQLAREGQHRLAICDARGDVVGILCQSIVLKYLNDNIDAWQTEKDRRVREFRPFSFVVSILNTQPALRAFELMDQRNTSLNAVAVVDEKGKLTDVMSTHDLRGLLPGSYEFNQLWSSIKLFKSSLRTKYPDVNYFPVSCTVESTLEEVIQKLAEKKVHRIFVINDENEPIDIISQTDILRYVTNQHPSGSSWF